MAEGLTKIASVAAAVVGGLILLWGVSLWMQGGSSFWSSDTQPTPTAMPASPGYAYDPVVSIVWEEGSYLSRKRTFSVGAIDMDPAVTYEIRIRASTEAIGFNRGCSDAEWTGEFQPSSRGNRTYDSQTVVLYICKSEGSAAMTAQLLSGDKVHDSHSQLVGVH